MGIRFPDAVSALTMGHASDGVKSILSPGGTHRMPTARMSALFVGIQRVADEIPAQAEGTKFRSFQFPSELSNEAGVNPIRTMRKDHRG